MNLKEEIKNSQIFERRYLELLYQSELNTPKSFRNIKLQYLKTLFKLVKEYNIRIVFKELKIKILRFIKYNNSKVNIGILVGSLDKGGLEQVVCNLARGIKKFNVYIFITGDEYGDMGWILKKEGYYIYFLDNDYEKFAKITYLNKITIISAHYSIWQFNRMKEAGIRIFYTIHNSYTWINSTEKDLRAEAYKNVERFVAVSTSVKDFFCKKFDVSQERICVIENGFDENRSFLLKPAKKTRLSHSRSKQFIFFNVASFSTPKNQILLLSAFKVLHKKYPVSRLWLIGNILSEEYYDKLISLIKKYKLRSKVKILNFASQEELFELYRKVDCFVLSSLQEGAPNVLLESMYMGIPTISTDVGNAKNLLKNFGIVVENSYRDLSKLDHSDLDKIAMNPNQSNSKKLAWAMEQILVDYSLWKEKALASRIYIKKEYSMKKTVKHYEEVFSSERS